MVPGAGLEPASSSVKARVPTPSELPGACAAPGSGTVTFRVGRVATPGRRARRVATRPTGPRRPPSPSRHLERQRGLEPRTSTVEAWRSGLMNYCRLVVRRPSGGRTLVLRIESPAVYLPQPHGCGGGASRGTRPEGFLRQRASRRGRTGNLAGFNRALYQPELGRRDGERSAGAPAVGAADVPPRPGTSRSAPTLAGWWRQVPPSMGCDPDRCFGVPGEIRTPDPRIRNPVLHPLSYEDRTEDARVRLHALPTGAGPTLCPPKPTRCAFRAASCRCRTGSPGRSSWSTTRGPGRIRTADPRSAEPVRYQLRHKPPTSGTPESNGVSRAPKARVAVSLAPDHPAAGGSAGGRARCRRGARRARRR
jgi:hypothetical protein